MPKEHVLLGEHAIERRELPGPRNDRPLVINAFGEWVRVTFRLRPELDPPGWPSYPRPTLGLETIRHA